MKKKDGDELLAGRRVARRVPGAAGGAGHLRRARRAPGAGRRRQGRHHPPRHERRQPAGRRGPQLQGALRRGARPRLPVALPAALPARGEIGIFNRSYYEEVLVVRVHPENLARPGCPRRARKGDVWKRRYREINDWERYLVDNGYKVVKLSSTSPRRSSAGASSSASTCPTRTGSSRPPTPGSAATGTTTRRRSPRCSRATSTEWAPWYVIPADHKWFARIVAAAVIVDALIEIDPRSPKVTTRRRRSCGGEVRAGG